jgi:hypothetical protein
MWNLFNCYLSGRHEYGVWCEPGTIFLRCVHCGKRSAGWSLDRVAHAHVHATTPTPPIAATVSKPPSRVLPFDRAVAR